VLVLVGSALSEIGEHRRARELCDKLLSLASPLELYAEEIDQHRAPFRQLSTAFTHLALINAVMHVIQTEQAAQATTRQRPAACVLVGTRRACRGTRATTRDRPGVALRPALARMLSLQVDAAAADE